VGLNHTFSKIFNSLRVNIMPKLLTPTQHAIVEILKQLSLVKPHAAPGNSTDGEVFEGLWNICASNNTSSGHPLIVTVAVKAALQL